MINFKNSIKFFTTLIFVSILFFVSMIAINNIFVKQQNVQSIYGLNINNKQDLIDFKIEVNSGNEDFSNANVFLNTDIDMAGEKIEPIGSYENPFKGSFNGLGNKIENLKIEAVEDEDYIYSGLFGFIKNSQVGNIDIDLDYNKQSENEYEKKALIAGVVSSAENSEIINVSVVGNIDIEIQADNVYFGAIAAKADNESQIYRSRNSARINLEVDSEDSNIGGVVGYLEDSIILESFNF